MEYITIMKSILIQVLCFSSYVFVDACGSKPCLNGGTCIGAPNLGICRCPLGYSGDDCSIDACGSKPCLNGGTCFGPDFGGCFCPWGYSGDDCSIDACGSKPCLNGGTCVGAPDFCRCPLGYSGDDCSIDACKASPCRNGATCRPSYKGRRCICPWGYDGDDCSEDACGSKPCLNGGTCIGAPNFCRCPWGYSGDDCSIDKSVTIPMPQQPSSNGGTPGCKENTKLIVLVAVFGTALLISLIVVTGLVIKLKCHSSPPEAPPEAPAAEMTEQQPPIPGDGYCIPDNGSYLHPEYTSLE